MKLKFTKMQGAGNDFVVLDGMRQKIDLTPAQYQVLADRHFGVGCDQILLVEPATRADCDFRYRIFNADGGEVQQCGNGARCFVRFVHEQGLTPKREFAWKPPPVSSSRAWKTTARSASTWATAFNPLEIPFVAAEQTLTYVIDVEGEKGSEAIEISALSMGNPHAVRVVCDTDSAPVQELGTKIEHHPSFPGTGQRRLHADTAPARDQTARVRARCRRDARLRHRRLRRRGRRHHPRPARPPRCKSTPARRPLHPLGRHRPQRLPHRPGRYPYFKAR